MARAKLQLRAPRGSPPITTSGVGWLSSDAARIVTRDSSASFTFAPLSASSDGGGTFARTIGASRVLPEMERFMPPEKQLSERNRT
ncbi:hypothetical protein D9M70_565500 [compost metagenome]